jgi:hypothetical protein
MSTQSYSVAVAVAIALLLLGATLMRLKRAPRSALVLSTFAAAAGTFASGVGLLAYWSNLRRVEESASAFDLANRDVVYRVGSDEASAALNVALGTGVPLAILGLVIGVFAFYRARADAPNASTSWS